jgi:hypothetical protein
MTTRKRRRNYKTSDKLCVNCLIPLDETNTKAYNIAQANYICTICRRLRDKQKYENRREAIRWQQRNYEFSVKIKVIEAYGGKCTCCGETTPQFLTIDHINNDGAADRKQNGKKSGTKLYRWLIQNGFPRDNYQLLCYNCNCSKGFFGYCPHNPPETIVRVTRNTHPEKDDHILAGMRALKASVLDGSTSDSAVSRSPVAKLE